MAANPLRILAALAAIGLMSTVVGLSRACAADYYVDSANPTATDSGPGSMSNPWSTLDAVNTRAFSPGDTIHFAAGSSYTGALLITSSGDRGDPIRVTSYGSGPKPVFSRPGKLNILTITGDWVVVDGLKFTDAATMSEWNNTTYVDSGAILVHQGADDVAVTNCEFTDVGVGIKSYGLRTKIGHCYFHDLVIAYSDSSLSYGAIGISLDNSDARVSYNRFVNCRSTDSPYGADGGAIEIEGLVNEKNDIRIDHNYSEGSQGFIEVTETQSKNVTISYNVSDDYQQFVAFDTTTTPYHYRVAHNTIVRTHISNATNVFAVFYYRDEGFPPDDSWLSIEDNVFYTPAAKALRGTYSYKPYDFPHSHNVFYDGTPDPIGYPPGPGDLIADPRFVDFAMRDLHLSADSPAIDAGVPLGFTKDFDGDPVPVGRAPDDGAYEYRVADPGFEEQAGGSLGSPWRIEGGGRFGVERADGKARTGSACASIAAEAAGQWNAILQTVPVSPDSTYEVSVYAAGSANIGHNVWIGIRSAGSGIKRQDRLTPSSAGYARLTAKDAYTTGPSETSIVIFIGYRSPPGSSWLRLDDVRLVKRQDQVGR